MAAIESGSSLVAWWGAGLSTTLGLIRLYEIWRDRFRLDVSCYFTGDPDIGNKILIRNLTGKPVILTHWELFYRSGHWPRQRDEHIESADPDCDDRRIEPHSTHTLHFTEATYFQWGHNVLAGRKIYIRLHLAGRRSQCRLVYSQ